MTEETQIPGVHVSPSNAETLVRRGRISNHRSIVYSFSSISAKNYQNWLMCIEVSVLHQCSFFETQYTMVCSSMPNFSYKYDLQMALGYYEKR